MKTFTFLLAAGLLCGAALINCSTLGLTTPPSICDNMPAGESLLCDLAHKYDIHLETAGNILMFTNFDLIEQGVYSRQDALEMFGRLRQAASQKVTGSALVAIVRSAFNDKPNLAMAGVLIVSPYLGYLDVQSPIKDADSDMLVFWIDQQIGFLK